MDHTLTDNEYKEIVMQKANKFVLIDEMLHRKIRDGVTAPYIEFEFRGDLMQSIHNQYGHLSYQSLANVFETHA